MCRLHALDVQCRTRFLRVGDGCTHLQECCSDAGASICLCRQQAGTSVILQLVAVMVPAEISLVPVLEEFHEHEK